LTPFTHVTALSLTSCHLTSLANLPPLPHLLRLDLADNRLPDHSLSPLLAYTHTLRTLLISHNLLRTLDSLGPLRLMTALKELEVQGNPVCEVVSFREEVFGLV
jgi:Leucine-rich repeat (LRR) protein